MTDDPRRPSITGAPRPSPGQPTGEDRPTPSSTDEATTPTPPPPLRHDPGGAESSRIHRGAQGSQPSGGSPAPDVPKPRWMVRSALWACPGCPGAAFERVEDYRTHYIAVHTPFFASKWGHDSSGSGIRHDLPQPGLFQSTGRLWQCPACRALFELVVEYYGHYDDVHRRPGSVPRPFLTDGGELIVCPDGGCGASIRGWERYLMHWNDVHLLKPTGDSPERGPTDSLKVREVRIPVPSPTLQTLLGPEAGTQVLAYWCLKCDRWMQTVEGYAKHGVAPKSGPAAALQGPEAPAALGIDEAAGVDDNIWGILEGKLQAVPAPRGLIRNDRGMEYGCPGCEDEFKEHAEYRLHWLSLHKRPAVPPQREHGQASPQEGPMDSEKAGGGSPVPAVCEHCGLFYAPWVHDGAQFKRHVLLHVENPEEKKYVGTETLGHLCPFSDACSAFESTRWALALHMKSKHGHDPVYYLLRFKTRLKYEKAHAPIPVGDSGHPIPRFCEYCGEPTDNGTTGWLIHREGAHDIREKYTTDPPLPPLGVNPDDLDVALAVFRVLQKSSAMRGNFKRLLAGG